MPNWVQSTCFGTRRRIFVSLSVLTVAFGIPAFVMPEHWIVSRVALAITESLIVAVVLALAVDPFLKATGFKETAEEISESLFWDSMSPNCPPEYREKIKELAKAPLFVTWDYINVGFEWAQTDRQILSLTITITGTYRNTSGRPYTPDRHPWILASTLDHESEFLQWILKYEAGEFDEVVDRRELIPYLERRSDGAIVLNEVDLIRRFEVHPMIAPDADFQSTIKGRMYRHSRGYLPLILATPVAGGRLRCSGQALAELDLRCLFGGRQVEVSERTDGQIVFSRPHLSAPGEGFLLSWKLRVE